MGSQEVQEAERKAVGRGCRSWGEQRTLTGCSNCGLLGWRPSVGWGGRGLAHVGVNSYLSRTAFSISMIHPSLPKGEPRD